MKIKPLTIVVLDDSGNIVACQREDGASMARYDIALGKSWGAVAMSCSSARSASAPRTIRISFCRSPQRPRQFLPQPGAVIIKDAQGNILGAAGASAGRVTRTRPAARMA